MKIAMPVKNDAIFQHFGMAPNFKIYVVQDGAVISTETIAAGGHGHAAVVNLLVKNAVDCVICGGLGPGAVQSRSQTRGRMQLRRSLRMRQRRMRLPRRRPLRMPRAWSWSRSLRLRKTLIASSDHFRSLDLP